MKCPKIVWCRAKCDGAFSLIELLVVITIIVVLLALLTPALDRAIYEAQITACAAHQKGLANGALMYATGQKRRYPYRPGVENVAKWHPEQIVQGQWDDRTTFEPYFGIDQMLDPLAGEVDLDKGSTGTSHVFANYDMFFGYRYAGNPGMRRIGDRWGWRGERFEIMAGDIDMLGPVLGRAEGSHPDHDGTMTFYVNQNEPDPIVAWANFTWSRWENRENHRRSPVDLQWIYDDGAVRRFDDLEWDDGRYTTVPAFADGSEYDNGLFAANIPKGRP